MIKTIKISSFLTLIIICILLGFWQIDRGEEKDILYNLFTEQSLSEPVLISSLNMLELKQYARVELKGVYIKNKQFLLDNKINNKKAGYEILTPLLFKNKIILVNRGWVSNNSRQTMPDIEIRKENDFITGYIYYYPEAYELMEDNYLNNWPLIIQNIKINEISQMFNKNVLPYVVVMDQEQTNSFKIQSIHEKNPAIKHYMYAGQWFLFSLIGLVFMIILIREEKNESRSD